MNVTTIEWTDKSWNPVSGCNKVSAGCKFCYAERIALEGQKEGKGFKNGFEVTLKPWKLNEPMKQAIPKLIFVNSMSDLFHEDIPISYSKQVFDVMNKNRKHIFQVLTKRSNNLKILDKAGQLNWSDNVWQGVSVENEDYVHRIDDLRATGAMVKFLSLEPLIGPLSNLNLEGIDWVIVGGESGPIRRPIKEKWVWDIKSQCEAAGVPFFFKQWGGEYSKSGGNLLRGKQYLEWPQAYHDWNNKIKEFLSKKGLLHLWDK